ncbi:response regulator transcription factor [Alkalicaulis satelles]|uniref:Response regulator transcription factor n=1 Tax=Alkalicaulis satelles TaxID=2609175 RepID=A0A5M6ZMD5_9PROT|nr:response regulator transcription factor [Alkalicaulis satelles]KAA5803441.1 response regulator transcription factor [Alkalicaulis satelles]
MTPRTILLVDDDDLLREALAEQFGFEDGFTVLTAPEARPGMEIARSQPVDLIILDVGLPDLDGREACRELRQEGVATPIILLTAQSGDEDHIEGLRAGADDFLAKPISFVVLLERVHTQLKRHQASEDAVLPLGPYRFKPAMKQLLTADEKKIRLTEKETGILRYLYRAGGNAVPREELLDQVWGYHREANTHTLETHVYRLRQKIEPDPQNARLLITETGGYRLQV